MLQHQTDTYVPQSHIISPAGPAVVCETFFGGWGGVCKTKEKCIVHLPMTVDNGEIVTWTVIYKILNE